MPSMTVPGPYQDADQAVVDQLLLQAYYRQLGLVALHTGINRVHDAAVWLSQNGRDGSVKWLVPGRVLLWTGVTVAPNVSGSPTMDVYIFGAALTQWNSVMVRRGWWELYLAPPPPPI